MAEPLAELSVDAPPADEVDDVSLDIVPDELDVVSLDVVPDELDNSSVLAAPVVELPPEAAAVFMKSTADIWSVADIATKSEQVSVVGSAVLALDMVSDEVVAELDDELCANTGRAVVASAVVARTATRDLKAIGPSSQG